MSFAPNKGIFGLPGLQQPQFQVPPQAQRKRGLMDLFAEGNRQQLLGLGIGLLQGSAESAVPGQGTLGAGLAQGFSNYQQQDQLEQQRKFREAQATQQQENVDRNYERQVNRDGVNDEFREKTLDRGIFESDRNYSAGRDDADNRQAIASQNFDLRREELNYRKAIGDQNYALKVADFQNKLQTDPKLFEKTQKLRKEYNGESKVFKDSTDAFIRVKESYEDPSAAGDLALIFNYMKVLDPGSTVREGEFANAQNSASVPQQLRAKYNQVISGERLGKVQRDDFFNRATKLYKGASAQQDRVNKRYSSLADKSDIPSDQVVFDYAGELRNSKENVSSEQNEASQETKLYEGEQYIKINGQWFKQ